MNALLSSVFSREHLHLLYLDKTNIKLLQDNILTIIQFKEKTINEVDVFRYSDYKVKNPQFCSN